MTFSNEQEDDLVAYIKDLDSRLMFVLPFWPLNRGIFSDLDFLPLAELNKTMQVTSVSQGIN
jgi:hypothetical protein